jgi:acetolactate synthase I/III small subunit
LAVIVDNESGRAGAGDRAVFGPRLQHRKPDSRRSGPYRAICSRITIVTRGTPQVIDQIKAQLARMVPVHAVRMT